MHHPVQFPEGPRLVEFIVWGRTLLGKGQSASTLATPRLVAGFNIARRKKGGWVATPV